MGTVEMLRLRAQAKRMTIALPEFEDERTREAIGIIEKEKLANLFIPTPDAIDSALKEQFIEEFYQLRQAKGIDRDAARRMLDEPLYYAAMMTRAGKVDGFVAGAVHTTPDVVRAALQCIGIDERLMICSSAFIMEVPQCKLGENGTFIYADCGVIPEPNPRQLACIAVSAAELAQRLLQIPPRVALLSYSTHGSAQGKNVGKVVEALQLAKGMSPGLLIDGELQVDAAIVPEVARIKYPDSPIEGRANVLVFPNLEAGNISYKLTQRLANARAIGPLLMGLNKPCSDLSRGCLVEDIVDCVAVTAIRAQ